MIPKKKERKEGRKEEYLSILALLFSSSSVNLIMNSSAGISSTASSNQSGSNDFVKKLFQMLQEISYQDVVTWTTNGDSFVVLNTNEFTKEILPRHFKHSNFASFVRQLNKYDFHKVKIPNDEKQHYKYGEDAWEFKHPDFRVNDREALENIKRKGPTTKKGQALLYSAQGSSTGNGGLGPSGAIGGDSSTVSKLKEEVSSLRQENKALFHEVNVIRTKYKAVVDNIIGLKNFDERYYQSMGLLINSLMQAGIKLPPLDFPNPNLVNLQQAPPPSQQQGGQPVAAHSHSNSMSQITPPGYSMMIQQPGQSQQPPPPPPGKSFLPADPLATAPPFNNSPNKLEIDQNASPTQAQVQAQVNHIQAQTQQASQPTANPSATALVAAAVAVTSNEPQLSTTNLVNPKFHVLLVEDDNVCIQLCRKFLVKYGCQVTVATDGLNAILTVEHTRYDLVLMDIVMPNLDGATATSVIRSFDTRTPIIAMTGNIEEYDLVTYLENGMSDILAKPFTKDDLYNMLSKHLLTPNATPGTTPNSGTIGVPSSLGIKTESDVKRQRLS